MACAGTASGVLDHALHALRADRGRPSRAGHQPDAGETDGSTTEPDGSLTADDLLAYVYALGGTAAFSDRFGDLLGEAAGPVRIPITADPALFGEAVALGRGLLWRHT